MLRVLDDDGDLAEVPLETIADLIAQNNAIYEDFGRRTLRAAIRIGQLLTLVKSRVGHGEWLPWLEMHTGYSARHAQRFVELAANATSMSHLPDATTLTHALSTLVDDRKRTREEQDREDMIARAKRKREGRTRLVPELPAPGEVFMLPEGFTLLTADAAHLEHVKSDTVDLQIFSPPYNCGIEYFDDIDDDLLYNEYLDLVDAWCREAYRVAADRGRVCVNIPVDIMAHGTPQPIMTDWMSALKAAGFKYRHTIFWTKGGAGHTAGHVARGTEAPGAPHVFPPIEVILVVHKGEWNLGRRGAHDLAHEEWLAWTDGYWRDLQTWDDILPAQRDGRSPAPWPEELPERLIKLYSYPDAVVMDQFLGSGTSAAAAYRIGRRFLGSDLSATSVGLASKLLATLQLIRSAEPD